MLAYEPGVALATEPTAAVRTTVTSAQIASRLAILGQVDAKGHLIVANLLAGTRTAASTAAVRAALTARTIGRRIAVRTQTFQTGLVGTALTTQAVTPIVAACLPLALGCTLLPVIAATCNDKQGQNYYQNALLHVAPHQSPADCTRKAVSGQLPTTAIT